MKSSAKAKEAMTHKIKQVLIDPLGEELAAVVLYGSYAVGREDEYSDIDLLIVIERQFQDWRERRQLEVELRKLFSRSVGPVSPVVLSVDDLSRALEAYYPLLLDALETGVVLFDKGCFAELRVRFSELKQSGLHRDGDHYWHVAL
jgi:predicted nucleotidyltransferase